jgi:hypothetical protein
VSEPFPSPTIAADSRTEVFLRYLEFFRSRVTVQEYARHVGHLDIVTELATGASGE